MCSCSPLVDALLKLCYQPQVSYHPAHLPAFYEGPAAGHQHGIRWPVAVVNVHGAYPNTVAHARADNLSGGTRWLVTGLA